jgi:hypothetical protein
MSTEEEEITLVVEGNYLTTFELWEWGEEGAEYSADGVTEESGKVVQDELGYRWVSRDREVEIGQL